MRSAALATPLAIPLAVSIAIPAALAPIESSLAEVTGAGPGGFVTVHETTIQAPRVDVWQAMVAVGDWWSSDHTIAGDAGNLTIELEPLGCFCERLGDKGDVVHMTVTFVNHGVILRLTGGLGPLGLMGVSGNMTWELFDGDAGDTTDARFTYAVGGYYPDGLDSIAPAVDYVIGEALQRLRARIETGDADNVALD